MKDFLDAVGWNDYQALTREQKAVGWMLVIAVSAFALMASVIE